MRDHNTLHEKGSEIALGVIILSLLVSVFVAGLAALYLAKTDKFKINEDNILLRVIKCIVIASGISLLILIASGAGFLISDIFGFIPRYGKISLSMHMTNIAPTAVFFAIELFFGLLFADMSCRYFAEKADRFGNSCGVAISNSLRVSLYLSFTFISTVLITAMRGASDFNAIIGSILVGSIRSAVRPFLEILQFISISIENPSYAVDSVIGFVSKNMTNVFGWTPAITKWLLILTIFDLTRRALKQISRTSAK